MLKKKKRKEVAAGMRIPKKHYYWMYTITIPSKEKRNVPHTKKKKVSLSSTTTVLYRGVYGGYTTIRLLCSTVVELHAASSSPRGRAVPTPTPHTSRSSSASSGSVEPYYYSLLPHTYTQSHARMQPPRRPGLTRSQGLLLEPV